MWTPGRVAWAPALVLTVIGLTVAGWTVGYRLSYMLSTPICPVTPRGDMCAVGGSANPAFYWIAWWFGGALAGLGAGLLIARSVARRIGRGST